MLCLLSAVIPRKAIAREYPFRPGEELRYRVSYNWGILWIDAGEAEFRADTALRNGVKVFEFNSFGSSYRVYDVIFRVRDFFHSIVRYHDFEPLFFSEDIREGGRVKKSEYLYDPELNKVYIENFIPESGWVRDSLTIASRAFDVLSGVYYLRTLDYANMLPGDTIPITLLAGLEKKTLDIVFHGHEILPAEDGAEISTWRFSTVIFGGTIFRGNTTIDVWVTDDEWRIPVLIESTLIIGSVKVYLIDE